MITSVAKPGNWKEVVQLNFNFDFTALVAAGVLCIIIAYSFGYHIGFKRGFDGDPIFKHKED